MCHANPVTDAAHSHSNPNPTEAVSRWRDRAWEIGHPLALLVGVIGIGYAFALLVIGVDQVGGADWLQRFFMSPGAAGLAAVAAAIIGFVAISLQLRHNKQVQRDANWWDTFEWVAERAVPSDGSGAFLDDAAVDMMNLLVASTDDVTRKRLCSAFLDRLDTLESASVIPESAETLQDPSDKHEGASHRSTPWTKWALQDHPRDTVELRTTANARLARSRATLEDYSKLTSSDSVRSVAVESRLYELRVAEAVERVVGSDFAVLHATRSMTTVWVTNAVGARIRVIASGASLVTAAHRVVLAAATDDDTPVLLVTQTEKPDIGTKVSDRAFTVRWRDESDDDDLRSGVLAALAEARPQEV